MMSPRKMSSETTREDAGALSVLSAAAVLAEEIVVDMDIP
jgi:hypothetical protein